MKRNMIVSIICLLIVLSGCSNRSENTMDRESSNDMELTQESNATVENGTYETEDMNHAQDNVVGNEVSERLVIFQGDMVIEVQDYRQMEDAIKKETEKLGGYIVESSYVEERESTLNGTIVLRLPKQYFHSFLEHVASGDGKVLQQSTHGNDVTEEFVDLDARLLSKRLVEERLIGFMKQANSTDNLLKISNELATIQEEIEQIVGKMKYIENQVDLSTITIYIQEKRIEQLSFKDEESLNTWKYSKNMFISTINFLVKVGSKIVILFIGLSPIMIPIGCVVGGFIIWKRKKNNK